ncbi:hypothetical protein GCM10018790_45910 [Kitasatospora xanthocidica]|nr:hypothetical protein GCM10018790_45910 [Kitasatospora xanthocidica]
MPVVRLRPLREVTRSTRSAWSTGFVRLGRSGGTGPLTADRLAAGPLAAGPTGRDAPWGLRRCAGPHVCVPVVVPTGVRAPEAALSTAESTVEALRGVAVDRAGVRTGAVSPGRCARAAGRVRFNRSGRLKTSHGSRLFDGEGPTGEDNAARAAGPPTG